jgi:integrase/recombinase XerD
MSILLDLIEHGEKAPTTKTAYRRCVQRFLAFAGPEPAGWTPQAVMAWRDALRGALGGRTVNKHLYALRYASKLYEAFGHGADFARAVEAVHEPLLKKRDALAVDEARALLAACCDPTYGTIRPRDLRDRAIITVGIRTGLRASELAGLNWGMIDGREATVAAKGRKAHTVVLDDECLERLNDWATWLESQGYSLRGAVFRGVSMLGIDNQYRVSRRLSRQKLWEAVAARGRQAGLRRPVHPHLFRHTFISWALEAGVPPQRVMIMTGHRSMETLSRYVTDLEAVSDPVGAHLPSLEG